MKKYLLLFLLLLVSVLKSNAINIVSAEYFWDTDPGVGMGISLGSLASSDSINFTRIISSSGLSGGFHLLYIRTKDANGIWSLSEGRNIFITPTITAAEYFFDTDPGVGNGIALSSFAASDSININRNISTTNVAGGNHVLYIRTKNGDGKWSLSEGRNIFITPIITAAEYFFDTDPGVGNGITFSAIAANDSINIARNISTTNIGGGNHVLYIRTQNGDGKWSLSEGRNIFITPIITAAEYFFDTDPGVGNGITLSAIAANDSINIARNISTTNVAGGNHILYIRTKNGDGKWSLSEGRNIFITPIITAAEYFFDTDPGVGNGIPLSNFAPSDSVNINQNISTASLTYGGNHLFYIRTKNSDGKWSLSEGRNIFVTPYIFWGEYFWDTDPGFLNGTPLPVFGFFGTYTDSLSALYTQIPVTGLTPGTHTFYARFEDNFHHWSLSEGRTMQVKIGIIAAEYFIDADPGIGNGTSINITANDTINISKNITLPNLSPGLHKMYVRTQDSYYRWSLADERSFVIYLKTLQATTITGAEYYFDNDPGLGNATALANVTAGATVNYSNSIVLPQLSGGFHKMCLRTKDNNNKWSLADERGLFIYSNSGFATSIVEARYFIDTDPGIGNDFALNITTGATVNFNTAITLPQLSFGNHLFYLRTKDNNGKWSIQEPRLFYCTLQNASQITNAEFFVDNDPGIGSGTSVTITTPSSSVSQCSDITLPSFTTGTHKLFFRTKDNNNVWSLQEPRTFTGIASGNISISPASPVNICAGSSVTLTATTTGGPLTYQWFTNCVAINGATSPTLVVTTSGSYTLVITNGANSQTATVVVNVISLPQIFDVTGGGIVCSAQGNGAAVGLNNSQTGINYQLILNTSTNVGTPVAGIGSAITFPNQTNGVYTVFATTAIAGCTAMMNGSAIINLSNITLSTNVSNVVCKGFNSGSISVSTSGGVSPYHYVWYNGSTSSSLSNLFAGTYQVTVTDAIGCTKTGIYTVTQPATVLSISISKTTIRCGAASTGILTALPAGGGGIYTYSWSNGKTDATISSIPAGTYIVSVTDNNGCTKTKSVVMTENPVIIALGVASTPTIATVSITGGVAPFAYNWNSSPQQTTITATGLIAGHTYKVKVTDSKGCTKIASVNMPSSKQAFTTSQNDITVYPNPTSGFVTINGFKYITCKIKTVLTDVAGRKVYESSEIISDNSLEKDFSFLRTGVYFVCIEYGDERKTIKLIKE